MKYLINILCLLIFSHYTWADDISSNGLICEIEQKESKRAPNKKLIYHFDNGNVYAVQVSKQNSPITINKNSVVGAGSVITENVNKKSLALSRSPQVEIKNNKRK